MRRLSHAVAAWLPVALLMTAAATPAVAQEGVESGRRLATRLCAQCHAIDRSDHSPLPTAPAFRHLEPRVDLDELQENLRRGLLAGHPDMPVFVLHATEARALVTYLKAIRAP